MAKRKKQISKRQRVQLTPKLANARDMIFELREVKTWKATQIFINSLYRQRVAKGIPLSYKQYYRLRECYNQWIENRSYDY